MRPMENPPIALFAHERGDARVMKRIAALSDQGWKVLGFTFHRVREKADVPPFWENIHLGTTYNRRYLQRVWAFAACLGVLWRNRARLGGCSVIYAINTDNALLALLGRFLAGGRAPVVLELADIQPAMTGRGIPSRVFRAIERFVLGRIHLLVTTSPGFVRGYFQPVQGFTGDIFLLENKVYPAAALPAAGSGDEPVEGGNPWVVGCFGALRCRRSIEMMRDLALKADGRVKFVLRGYPAGTIADEFEDLLGADPNLVFLGPYVYPDDLAGIYRGVDLTWTIDESDPTGNSAWLLPNRIYEGGLFNVPAVAASGTETGNWVERHGCGWAVDEPLVQNLAKFFASLNVGEWRSSKRRCSTLPREFFAGENDYQKLSQRLLNLATAAEQGH